MIARLLLAGLVILVAASCGIGSESSEPIGAEAVTTTYGYDPPSEQLADKSVLPALEEPGRFDRGRTRIGAIEGFGVDDASAWAFESGWREVLVIDIDNPDVERRPAAYIASVLGLYERDGIVIEAWVGG